MTVEASPRILVFRAGGRRFGIGAAGVEALARGVHVTPVPLAPSAVLGLTGHRGGVACVFDAARLVGLAPLAGDAKLHLFVRAGGEAACLEVDAVDGVFDAGSAGAPTTPTESGVRDGLPGTASVDGDDVPVLDLERLLDPVELASATRDPGAS